MKERIRMLSEYRQLEYFDLCRHGICRDTFYEWRKRREGDTARSSPIALSASDRGGHFGSGYQPRRRSTFGTAQAAGGPEPYLRDLLAGGFDR